MEIGKTLTSREINKYTLILLYMSVISNAQLYSIIEFTMTLHLSILYKCKFIILYLHVCH